MKFFEVKDNLHITSNTCFIVKQTDHCHRHLKRAVFKLAIPFKTNDCQKIRSETFKKKKCRRCGINFLPQRGVTKRSNHR